MKHSIVNPFQFMTKREVVESVEDTESFRTEYVNTISCSHPCNPRWKGLPYPQNCGYCYPCLIRKVSLMNIESGEGDYSDLPFSGIQELLESNYSSTNDLKAIIASVHRYTHVDDNELRRLVTTTGFIRREDVDKHVDVYKRAMNDLTMYLLRKYGYKED